MPSLTISIVTYQPDREMLERTLASLLASLVPLQSVESRIYIIDNSASLASPSWLTQWCEQGEARLIHGRGNIGYGAGHNLVLAESGDFHLILNPDVELTRDSLVNALAFMNAHPECGLITPASTDIKGHKEYLCKRYPDLLTLLVRGFAPEYIRQWFERRISYYEMRDLINDQQVYWDPLIVSGCFMFFRGEILRQLNGFDDAYFLYFEDFDLSLRTSRLARIAYVPGVNIQHLGGKAAKKGWSHVQMFGRSLYTFFNTHGWKLC